MIEMVQQLLNITLFAHSGQPFVVMSEFASNQYRRILPGSCRVAVFPDSPTYLTQLWSLLDSERPACLLLIPPFIPSGKLPQKIRAEYPQLDLYEISFKVAVNKASAGSLVGVLAPHGFLLNRSSQKLRDELNQTVTPRYVIDFDFGFNQIINEISPQLKLHLIIVETGEAADRLVRFFRCPDVPVSATRAGQNHYDEKRQKAILDDLRRLNKQGGGPTEFGFILREGIPAGTPWLYDRHHPSYQRRLEDLSYVGQVRPLGDLVEMWFGFRPTEYVNQLIPGQESGRGIPVIEGRDIGQDNLLSYGETRYRILPEGTANFQLQSDDICLRSIIGPGQKLKAVKIEEAMLPLAASNSILVLRPKPELKVDVNLLVTYLQSDRIVHTLRAQGVAHHLYPNTLAEVPVPVQDQELQAALNDLRSAAQAMGSWQAEAEATIRSIFDYESIKDARVRVLAAGRRIRQRERAALQTDDLSYRLRTGLPYPLAYRWRIAETAQPSLEGYRDVLECAETATCYLALVALLLARSVGEAVGYLTGMSDRLSNIGHGTNFGDWISILREVQGNKSLKKMAPVPFYEVSRFLDDETVDQALALLKQNRDDEAHGRGPHGAEIAPKIEESRAALQTLLKATEFLTEYSLRYIEETRRDSIAGITTYRYRNIMGDHAIVGIEDGRTDMAELEAHSLYLMDRNGNLYLIRPYLIRRECPQCKNWELFYLDTYRAGDKTCQLKSMTTGHMLIDNQVPDVFRHVGMLM